MKGKFDIVSRGRINWVLLFFLMTSLILIGRMFLLQIINYREYVDAASRQHRLVEDIFSERGEIFLQDKNGNLIPSALNKIQKNLSASPREIKDPTETSERLSKIVPLAKDDIFKKLSSVKDSYEVVLKDLDTAASDQISKLKVSGIFLEEEQKRVYPHASLGAAILGFVSKDKDENEIGRYGVESFYEKELSGRRGLFEGVKDAGGSWIALGDRIIHPPKNGSKIVLTIDYNIQLKTEQVLADILKKWGAVSGSILVIDPQTGRVLAMGVNPTFDPNEFFKVKDYGVFINPLVESMYELGSVMKTVTMAGGLEEKVVTPETTYTDPGVIQIAGYKISNADGKTHDLQTMTQVMEKSLNTGAVFVSQKLGHEKQLEYLKRFGFGVKTGIDLPGEVSGNISNLNSGRDVDFYTASFGQGIAITPIQLSAAVSSIANGGRLIKPYIVERIIDENGQATEIHPQEIRKTISADTAEKLTKMLVSVVKNGYNDRAGIKGYFVAGKTGTAQIARKDGRGGYSDEVIHSFIGYAPAFNPKFLIFLQMNEPKAQFAANTLPPFFKELGGYILNYYEVPPDTQ